MEILTRRFVAVETTEFFADPFGKIFISLDFCLRVAESTGETEERDLNSVQNETIGKAMKNLEPLPTGLEWCFDDKRRVVHYGEVLLKFHGEIQYRLLKMASSGKELNNRDVRKDIWGDTLTEWRMILDAAKQVNLKLDRENIPYKITVNSAFTKLSEKI